MGFLRDIFIRIDAIVYGILEQIFQLIINLANFDLFSAGVLDEFAKRIYLILGLVMVFKLILSFIQILIDPDKISDKESGVANILKRVVISMILIVLVPSIFSFAKQLQNRVLPLIPKVVLGIPLDVDDSQISYNATTTDPIAKLEDEQGNVMVSTGKLMAYYSFLPFFYYNSGCEGLGTLNGTTSPDKSMNVEIYSVSDAVPHVNDKDGACSSTEDGYNYNYRYIISTLVGAYMVYVLVTVALKIAIRTIKFGLCQLVAPIPIASYIDPKSSKKAFDNWVSTSVKVYLDLFMRLIVVYFIIYVFRLLFDNEKFFEVLGKYGAFQGLLVALFIIVGLLYFAQEMPKFVSDMLGVPDGFSDIGDMFKGQGFKAMAGAAGMVHGTGKAIASGISNSWDNSRFKDGNLHGWRRGLMAGFSGINALRNGLMSGGRTAIRSGAGVRSIADSNSSLKEAYVQNKNSGNSIVDTQLGRLTGKSKTRRDNARLRGEIDRANNDINELRGARGRRRISEAIRRARDIERNAMVELDQANQMVNHMEANYNDAENELSNAQGRLATAEGELQNAQTSVSNLETSINNENTTHNQHMTELTSRRDIYSNYASLLEKRKAALDAVDIMRDSVRNAVTEDEKIIARKGLEDAITEYQNYDRQLNKIMSENQGLTWENDVTAARNQVASVNNEISLAEQNHNNSVATLESQLNTARADVQTKESAVNTIRSDVTTKEAARNAAQTALDQARQEAQDAMDTLTTVTLTPERLNEIQAEEQRNIDREIDRQQKKIEAAQEAIVRPFVDSVRETAYDFVGKAPPRSQDLLDLSSGLKQIRADVLVSEAFGKIAKNISEVNAHLHGEDANGNRMELGHFRVENKNGHVMDDVRFEDMANWRDEFATGRRDSVTVSIDGHQRTLNRAEFKEYMESAEKVVGAAYVNAVIHGEIDNEMVYNAWQQEIERISGMNIPKVDKDRLLDELKTNFGRYLLKASDRASLYKTKGQSLKNHEALLQSKNSNNG